MTDHKGASHLTVVSKREPPASETNDAIVIGCSVLAAAAAVLFALGLRLGWSITVHGSALAVGLFSMAIAVRRYFTGRFPDIEAVEPRQTGEEEHDATLAEVTPIGRRPLVGRVLAAAAALFGLGLLSPIPSLGPSVGDALRRTAWRQGIRLVDSAGEPLRPEDVALGGVSTVWPEGFVGQEDSSVILVRLAAEEPRPPTVLDWVVDGELVAYSKVCTHAGCPVGLFRERDAALFCPCHQSTFDAARGAVPTFGPTARPLPQLPMELNDEGFLVALGDFQDQVGPAFG